MFRFVHVADVHLDTPLVGRGDARRKLARSLELAFRGAVDLCLERSAHALVIAGDLFDGARLTLPSERLLDREFERLTSAGVAVFAVAGNHDPGSGPFARHGRWPQGVVHVADARAAELVVRDRDGGELGRLCGIGHEHAAVADNLAPLLRPDHRAIPQVAVLHAQVEGSRSGDEHARYAPCRVADLEALDFDYVALGHVHRRQRVCADPEAWYPGNLQGRHVGETGAKGALFVTIAARGAPAVVEFVPLARHRFAWWTLRELSKVERDSDLLPLLEVQLDRAAAEDPLAETEWSVRVDLAGATPWARTLPRDPTTRRQRLLELEEDLAAELGLESLELRDRGLRVPADVPSLRIQPHYLGEALRVLDQWRREGVPESALGELADLAQDAAERREQLDALLEGLDEELVERCRAEEAGA